MPDFLKSHRLSVGNLQGTPFVNAVGIYQDGTTPLYRDVDGRLWGMSGHSHVGHIGMFCGTSLEDMREVYAIQTHFCVGHADYAFSGICYPEGVKPRGSLWPFGLYICPKTHRFFCFFHNESGWNGKGTAYDAFGLCEKPRVDSDFRHVGLIHSDDEGKNWTFDRWVLTANTASFTESYNPMEDCTIGQKMGRLCLGSGDFSIYVEPDGEYIYLFYSMIYVNTDTGVWEDCDGYVARTRKRSDGLMGDFVKYYDGSFSESGLFGCESMVLADGWHPRVVYSEPEKLYLMSSKPIIAYKKGKIPDADDKGKVVQIATSSDLIHWSKPEIVRQNGKPWGNHYNAIVSDSKTGQPFILSKNTFSFLTNHNGTDVLRFQAKLNRNRS